ncbi:molybdate transport system ATP-binding protein [Nocardia transvalensis]|uniref:Molybdate transport system ATP-binding protein n=1 Tax=Nocardia transvalensis TaxID=37333 RepID=A0A7W9PJX2_9NOCA|nr:ABC transporter ATP-binding protein [Nocardia transvalensis]MBB5917397.1 molybdate transport system ATP-binding protein [Nocardia transvalensis]
MTLRAELRVERDRFRLDIDLTAPAGEVVALLGPNGAGKTTALRALAGLLPLTGGSIAVADQVWDAPPSVFVPAERRRVGVVFQDYLLFQHLPAVENVAFGLRARGMRRAAARARATEWLDRVGLGEHARSTPRALSGGQAQRVALARALATDPALLLLDEPLAALDASTRIQVRADLAHHLRDYPGHTVLVTHDPLDAMVLADRLVILERGVVVQQGPPTEIARRPRSEYVANLVGLNLFRGTAAGTTVDVDNGGHVTVGSAAAGPVFLAFPPTAVSLYLDRPTGSPRNTWPVTLTGLEQHADLTRVRLDGAPPVLADVTPAAVADLRLRPGMRLWAAVKASEIHVYPA